jgi:hypothetical protein
MNKYYMGRGGFYFLRKIIDHTKDDKNPDAYVILMNDETAECLGGKYVASGKPLEKQFYWVNGESFCRIRLERIKNGEYVEYKECKEESMCAHEWVNVGFTSLTLVCKICGVGKND